MMLRVLTRALENQTIRFFVTGVGAAALFYGLTFALLKAGAPPFGGTIAAYAVAFATSYTVQHRWTFGGRSRHRASFPRYLVAQVTCAAVSGLVARSVAAAGFSPAVIPLASTVVASAMSYGLTRYWVFAGEI